MLLLQTLKAGVTTTEFWALSATFLAIIEYPANAMAFSIAFVGYALSRAATKYGSVPNDIAVNSPNTVEVSQ